MLDVWLYTCMNTTQKHYSVCANIFTSHLPWGRWEVKMFAHDHFFTSHIPPPLREVKSVRWEVCAYALIKQGERTVDTASVFVTQKNRKASQALGDEPITGSWSGVYSGLVWEPDRILAMQWTSVRDTRRIRKQSIGLPLAGESLFFFWSSTQNVHRFTHTKFTDIDVRKLQLYRARLIIKFFKW